MHNIISPRPYTDEVAEAEIRHRGADTAPRVTPADIEACIDSEHFFTATDGVAGEVHRREGASLAPPPGWYAPPPLALLTFCVLVLRNGFTVTGESACVSPENFDAVVGRHVARENAKQKIWALEGYLLKDRLAKEAAGALPS